MAVKSSVIKYFSMILQLALIAFVSSAFVRAAGEVDPTFKTAVQKTDGGQIYRLAVQPDGKLLVAGNFAAAGNDSRTGIARLNLDGTLDETFSPPELYFKTADLSDAYIYAIAVQADGKILVGGRFEQVGTISRSGIVRLNADGSLDSAFDPLNRAGYTDGGAAIYDIVIQPDNRIILGGSYQVYGGTPPALSLHQDLTRFNPDGSIDESFVPASAYRVNAIALMPDGRVVFNNEDKVRRLNPNGSGDSSFNINSFTQVSRLKVQSDGKVLVARNYGGFARLNTDGTIDFQVQTTAAIRDIILLPDNKILVGGNFTSLNGVARAGIARFNADGTLDTTFNYTGGGTKVVYALALLNDGSYVAGNIYDLQMTAESKLLRILPNGTRDANYAGDVYVRPLVNRAITRSDGKILIGGVFKKVFGVSRSNVALLNADGTLDTNFNAVVGDTVNTVAAQSDGKVLVGGGFTSPRAGLARFNADGSLDASFQPVLTNSSASPNYLVVNEIIQLSDGKILIAGRFRLPNYPFDLNVARLNADGSTDTSFYVQASSDVGVVRAMKLQSNGKIVVAGQFAQIVGANRGGIARLNADGTIDQSFVTYASTSIYDFAIQSNGNIIVGGNFAGINGYGNHYYLAQLFPDGSLNQAFTTNINNYVYAVECQADDKILVGSFFNLNGKRGIARFNTDGTLDNSFVGTGANAVVRDIFIQNDSKILIGGEFSYVNQTARLGVARLLNASAGRTPYDFDGDGRADISVFRPSNGAWYLQQSTAGFVGYPFGFSSDVIAPADYDGDGKTDIAVFRPSNGTWYLQRSTQGFASAAFGAASDIPVPGDFDGDGKADLAVYRPSNGTWYIQQSTAGFVGIVFGASEDRPVAADYDGDGKTDIAVYRPSNGTWYLLRSTAGFIGIAFGVGTDKPVPADYDGDGKTDIAIFRPSTGYWYTSTNPATNYGAVLFGQNGDLPAPADYDGDGKADVAVFRPSNGAWYLNRSTQGFIGVAFGVGEDKPIPNAFVR